MNNAWLITTWFECVKTKREKENEEKTRPIFVLIGIGDKRKYREIEGR